MDAGQPPPPLSSETLMAALLTVPAARLTSLARALAADARRLRCRLAFLLLSPPHFARAIARLRAMPLHAKAALLGLILLAMCDSYSSAASSPSPVDWRAVIVDDVVASALSVLGLGAKPWAALAPYVDAAAKARRFADVVSDQERRDEGRRGARRRVVRRGRAVIGAAPTPRASSGDDGGSPCAICREEMAARGGVCALRPCGHWFHWRCARRWLARRNTCPCCRAELPPRDAPAETGRLWRAVERTAARGGEAYVHEHT